MKLSKYCALGNDYWVIHPDEKLNLNSDEVKHLCDRHNGLGGDGVLYGPLTRTASTFTLQIFNADGTLAEISGNGLSIFARYLHDHKWVNPHTPFNLIPSKNCTVPCQVEDNAIKIQLGQAHLQSTKEYKVPEALQSTFHLPTTLTLYEVNIGNPHCVVITEQLSENLAKALGPLLEKHPDFPHKTNVQFAHFDRLTNSANIEIWERGSGYTLGSGSSSCAVAFTYGHVYGLDTYTLSLKMPGGQLQVHCEHGVCSFYNQVTHVADIELTKCPEII